MFTDMDKTSQIITVALSLERKAWEIAMATDESQLKIFLQSWKDYFKKTYQLSEACAKFVHIFLF